MLKLIFVCLLILPSYVWAQCTPDLSIVSSGVYPTVLPKAYVDSPYTAVIQLRTPPKDTSIFTIDSFIIENYLGFPPSFTWACDLPDCVYLADANGCITVSGTADSADFGNHPLLGVIKVHFTVGVSSSFLVDTNSQFVLRVCFTDTCIHFSAVDDIEPFIEELNAYPNPVADVVNLDYEAEEAGLLSYVVFDVLGQVVLRQERMVVPGANKLRFNLAYLQSGIYVQRLRTERKVSVSKVLKQ